MAASKFGQSFVPNGTPAYSTYYTGSSGDTTKIDVYTSSPISAMIPEPIQKVINYVNPINQGPVNQSVSMQPSIQPIQQPTTQPVEVKSITGALQNIEYSNIIGVVASVMVITSIFSLFKSKK